MLLLPCGTPILKGYRITETPPVIAVNPLQAPHMGTVGPVIPGFAVKIEIEMDSCFGDLAGYEVSEKSLLIEIDFSIEAGELKPILKVKRKVVKGKSRRPH